MVPLRALLFSALLLQAQAPIKEVNIRTHAYTPPSAVLRAEANLVEAELTVRDSRGNAVPGLHASDFEVLDNGRSQRITAFSELRADGKIAATAATADKVSAAEIPPIAPKFVTFFFDDAHLSSAAMGFTKQAARAFIAKGLKPADRMSIVTASGQGDLDFTADAALFAEKLNHLASHTRPAVTVHCGVSATASFIFLQNLDYQVHEAAIDAAKPCACGDSDKSSDCRARALSVAQSLADSSWEQTQHQSVDTMSALGYAAKKLSEVNGTRILVLTSSGFLVRPGQPEVEKFVDGAVKWGIVVHALDAEGLNANVSGRTGLLVQSLFWTPLEKITGGTGGHFFKNTNDLAGAMNLAANPQVSYLLAFNPGARDGKFHTLKIRFRAKRPESVQFRPGYFSPAEKTLTRRATMDDAVFSKQTRSDFPAAVKLATSAAGVTVAITIDIKSLGFASSANRHAQQLVFLMTLLDANGAFVTGKEAIMDLMLTTEKLESLKKDGLKAVATLTAPAGNYQVRTIVREGMKGALAASTHPVALTN